MSKHTPGPWYEYYNQKCKLKNAWMIKDAKGNSIAHDMSNSNTRLIAASPALYEYAEKQAKSGCKEAQSMIALLHLTD